MFPGALRRFFFFVAAPVFLVSMEPKMVQGPAQNLKPLCMQNLPEDVIEYMDKEWEKRTTEFWRAEVRRGIPTKVFEYCCSNYECWREVVAHVLVLQPIFEYISKEYEKYGSPNTAELAHWRVHIEYAGNHSSMVNCSPENFLATLFDFMKGSRDGPTNLSIWSPGLCFCGHPNERDHHYESDWNFISISLHTDKMFLSHTKVFNVKDRVDFAPLCRK